MQQRQDELAFHPLAQRQLPDWTPNDVTGRQQLAQLIDPAPAFDRRNIVQRTMKMEGLQRRQIPCQLLLLPHHQSDRLEELRAPLERVMAQYRKMAAARSHDTREHFQRGGLARAITAEKTNHFTRVYREGNIRNSRHVRLLATKVTQQAARLVVTGPVNLVNLADTTQLDCF
ncbi:hypothetical protein D3C81_1427720 [compost metagenome]